MCPATLEGGREKPAWVLYFFQFKCLKVISAHALTLGDVITGDPSVTYKRGFECVGENCRCGRMEAAAIVTGPLQAEMTPALQPMRFWPKFFTVFVLILYLISTFHFS